MKNYLYIIILSIFMTGCSSLTVSSDYDNKIDFSNFKTYRWHPRNEYNASSLKYLDPIMDKRIRDTIDAQLHSQHYTKLATDAGKVDFLVNYSVVVDDRVDIRTYNKKTTF